MQNNQNTEQKQKEIADSIIRRRLQESGISEKRQAELLGATATGKRVLEAAAPTKTEPNKAEVEAFDAGFKSGWDRGQKNAKQGNWRVLDGC